jgi:hypothetical protein
MWPLTTLLRLVGSSRDFIAATLHVCDLAAAGLALWAFSASAQRTESLEGETVGSGFSKWYARRWPWCPYLAGSALITIQSCQSI